MRSLFRALAIIVVGSVAGLVANRVRGAIPLSQSAFLEAGDHEISVQQARARLDKGALFLDARPFAFYEMSHVPGARSLPEDEFDKTFPTLEPLLRSRLEVVVYCSGFGC